MSRSAGSYIDISVEKSGIKSITKKFTRKEIICRSFNDNYNFVLQIEQIGYHDDNKCSNQVPVWNN